VDETTRDDAPDPEQEVELNKPVSEMSLEEIEAFLARKRRTARRQALSQIAARSHWPAAAVETTPQSALPPLAVVSSPPGGAVAFQPPLFRPTPDPTEAYSPPRRPYRPTPSGPWTQARRRLAAATHLAITPSQAAFQPARVSPLTPRPAEQQAAALARPRPWTDRFLGLIEIGGLVLLLVLIVVFFQNIDLLNQEIQEARRLPPLDEEPLISAGPPLVLPTGSSKGIQLNTPAPTMTPTATRPPAPPVIPVLPSPSLTATAPASFPPVTVSPTPPLTATAPAGFLPVTVSPTPPLTATQLVILIMTDASPTPTPTTAVESPTETPTAELLDLTPTPESTPTPRPRFIRPFDDPDPSPATSPTATRLTELPGSSSPPAAESLLERLLQRRPRPVTTPRPGLPNRIIIPAIGVDSPVVEGDTWEDLKHGVGWHIGTALPGEPGNLVLSGHDDMFGEVFRYLTDLKEGDLIYVYSDRGRSVYQVERAYIVEPTELSILDPTPDATITLITCYPYRVDTKRYIVNGRLYTRPREPDSGL